MHLGVLSWGLALHSMSQVITIFGFKDMGYFAIVASCQQQSGAFFFQIKLILILLFSFLLEEDGRWWPTYLSANLADTYGHLPRRKKNSLNGWGWRHPRDCIWFCEIVYHGAQMWFLVMERVVMKACPQSRRFWPESSLHFSDRLTFSLCSSLPTPNLGIQSIALLQLS